VRVDVYRSSGPRRPSGETPTDSAVSTSPTSRGIVVTCQNETVAAAEQSLAMRVASGKLLERKRLEELLSWDALKGDGGSRGAIDAVLVLHRTRWLRTCEPTTRYRQPRGSYRTETSTVFLEAGIRIGAIDEMSIALTPHEFCDRWHGSGAAPSAKDSSQAVCDRAVSDRRMHAASSSPVGNSDRARIDAEYREMRQRWRSRSSSTPGVPRR